MKKIIAGVVAMLVLFNLNSVSFANISHLLQEDSLGISSRQSFGHEEIKQNERQRRQEIKKRDNEQKRQVKEKEKHNRQEIKKRDAENRRQIKQNERNNRKQIKERDKQQKKQNKY